MEAKIDKTTSMVTRALEREEYMTGFAAAKSLHVPCLKI